MLPVQYMKIPAKRRILVISDIHGNYDYLVGLLKKIKYSHRDLLFIDGDITEKGPQSLKTLTFLMMLAKHNDVYFVKGNCDNLFYRNFDDPIELDIMYSYIKSTPNSLWWEMFELLELKVETIDDFKHAIPKVHQHFKVELQFLDDLPVVIQTPKLTFAHAGLLSNDLQQNNALFCMKNNAFMENNEVVFDKYLIIGHWPVSNYKGDFLTCNPKFDDVHRVIGIDGGNCIKKFGQLNALIISGIDKMNFSFASYENSPTMKIKRYQAMSKKPVSIHYGDNEMTIVERKGPITRVKQTKTGYAFALPTHQLYEHEGKWYGIDYTDYLPKLNPGDEVYVYEYYDGRYLVKKDGIIGWYEE